MDLRIHGGIYNSFRGYEERKRNEGKEEQEIYRIPAQLAESRKRSGLTTLSRKRSGIPPREPMKSTVCSDASLFLLENKPIYWHNASETICYQ